MKTTTKMLRTGKNLTPKQAAFVKELLDNPQSTGKAAAMKAYPDAKPSAAAEIAKQNLQKPAIISALQEHNELIESTLINTVQEWGTHEKPRQREIAIDTAKFIHDKLHGKSTQKLEVKSQSINISIDLSQE